MDQGNQLFKRGDDDAGMGAKKDLVRARDGLLKTFENGPD